MKYKKFKHAIKNLEETYEVKIPTPTKEQFTNLPKDIHADILNHIIEILEYDRSPDSESEAEPADNPPETPSNSIDEVLAERGTNYGEFPNHASLSQRLKSTFDNHVVKYGHPELFTDTMNEAIEMVMHKLARIANGDPTYIDSWTDIIGYTQLVINDLTDDAQQ